jgi:glycosyltransferase involved in cell wall biosynthesis
MSEGRVSILHAVTDPISTILMRGQLSYLGANGFDPALLSSPGKELEETAVSEGYRVYSVPMCREISPLSDLLSFFRIVRLLRRIRPVICNSGTPKAGLLVGLASWFTRVPCRIYTLRGLRLETARGARRMILGIAEKLACASANRVVCVSASLRDRAIALGLVQRSKAVLLGAGSSNGVDPARFEPTPEKHASAAALRQTLDIRPDQPIIGFAGRLTRDKGIPELVTAFQSIRKELPDTVLLLVGNYEDGDPIPADTRHAIESDPAIRHVRFNSQIEPYYLAMNLFVLPTHREGFPNTILEAQAAGLPVVTTVATGAVDAIVDGVTGLLIPIGDARKLAESILFLLSDPVKMKTMGQLGRERVIREFRNEIVWEALASLYKSMLQEHGYPLPAGSRAEAVRCVQQ